MENSEQNKVDKNRLEAIKMAYDFVMKEENHKLSGGYNPLTKRWYPQNSVEGGPPTIAYGIKYGTGSKWAVIAEKQGYLTDEQAEQAARDAVEEHYNIASTNVNAKYGKGTFESLNPIVQFLLTDYDYTGTGIEKFPMFHDALVKGDINTALTQYLRHSGGKPLGRNKRIKDVLVGLKEEDEKKRQTKSIYKPVSDFSIKFNYKDNLGLDNTYKDGGRIRVLTNNYTPSNNNNKYIPTNNYTIQKPTDDPIDYSREYTPDFNSFYDVFSVYLESGVENSKSSSKGGWDNINKVWRPHNSLEGGEQTIGFGLKMYNGTPQYELYKTQGYLTEKQEYQIRKDITANKYNNAKETFNTINNDPNAFDKLSEDAKVFVVDYEYQCKNGIAGFPILMKALYNNDLDTALDNYRIWYKRDNGNNTLNQDVVLDNHRNNIHRYFLERFKNGSYAIFNENN